MRRLMLLRHAKTEPDAPSGSDIDRRLDDRGRSDAADIGAWLTRHRPTPDLVLVSSAVRAQQTWQLAQGSMQGALQPLVVTVPELYGAGPSRLLEIIHAVGGEDRQGLMVVGHNPGLHELALALVGSGDTAGRKALADNLPTSGLTIINFPIGDWNAVALGSGRLERFMSPKLLKKAGDG
jgi:phosphohistidine phosphatase